MKRGKRSRRGRPWQRWTSRITEKVDRKILVVALVLWGIGGLRFVTGEWEAVWAGLVIVALALAGILGVRTWSVPVLGTLVAERTLLTSWKDHTLFGVIGELLLQGLVAFGAPLLGRLNKRMIDRARREETRIREEARQGFDDDRTHGLSKPLDPGTAFERAERSTQSVVQLLKQSLRCQTALFAWADEAGDGLTVGAIASDTTDALRTGSFSIDGSRFSAVKKNAAPLVLRFGEDVALPPYYKDPVDVHVTVAMAIPVFMHRRLLGVFFLDRAEAIPFYLPDSTLADRARRVVTEFAEVSKELLQANHTIARLSSLNDAATAVSRARSFEEVYRAIVTAAVSLTGFRHAILSHRMGEEGPFELVAVTDPSLTALLGKAHSHDDGLCNLALKAGGPFPPANTIRTGPVAPPFGDAVGLELDANETHLMLPISAQDRPVAFLLMAGGEMPDKSQIEVLKLLGNLAGTSLVNAESNKDLERLATTDALTNLPNQRQLRARLNEVQARHDRGGAPFSLLFLDIDHFKRVNDNYGHPAGDEILRRVAGVLADRVRKVDLAARYGGEEFAVLLEGADKEGALIMAERIRTAVAAMDLGDLGMATPVTVSVGIASVPMDCADTDTLLATADEALYRAKREGRNRCVLAA
jgi:diguanylate cyclase (GGDEF)-like protein